MTQRSTTYLKARFETADIPTQSDYQDVFDSFVNLEASAAQALSGPLTVPQLNATIVSANMILHGQANVSASGTTQASAARLSNGVSYVLANDDERAVVLATCQPGRTQFIVNTNTTTISVFPASGGNFIGTAENAALLLAKNTSMFVVHASTSAYGVVRGAI